MPPTTYWTLVARWVEGDLDRFRQFIEQRGTPTGAWRGAIHCGKVEADSDLGGASSTGSGTL